MRLARGNARAEAVSELIYRRGGAGARVVRSQSLFEAAAALVPRDEVVVVVLCGTEDNVKWTCTAAAVMLA